MELVSIIMPTYNCGRFISESINSVLAQTYTNWELIIIDDGSTDNTYNVVCSFNDVRIKYFKNTTNLGTAIARNKGLYESQGRYIAFLDSDDLWLPEKLEKQINFMEQNGYVFTYTEYEEIDEISNPLGVRISGINIVDSFDLKCCNWMGCLTVMYDKQSIGLIQISNIEVNNDVAIWLQVIEKSNCYLLPEVLAKYRRRTNSITPKTNFEKIYWHLILFYYAAGMNIIETIFWTGMSIIGHIHKRIKYTKKVGSCPPFTFQEIL